MGSCREPEMGRRTVELVGGVMAPLTRRAQCADRRRPGKREFGRSAQSLVPVSYGSRAQGMQEAGTLSARRASLFQLTRREFFGCPVLMASNQSGQSPSRPRMLTNGAILTSGIVIRRGSCCARGRSRPDSALAAWRCCGPRCRRARGRAPSRMPRCTRGNRRVPS